MEMLKETYTIALPIVLTAFMGYIVWLLKNQKSDRDANSRGTMLLLRVQMIEYHNKYMALKEIPSYAYQNFMEMYDAYHALGGNGMVTKMKNEIEELHLKQKERILNMTDLGFLTEFMVPVIVGICLCVGYVVKKWIKDVDNKYIPTICAVLGVILAVWINGWTVTAPILLSGLFSGLASTGLHQMFKQYINKEEK